MSEAVKRTYSSSLRAEQARATRRTIVDAARQLYIERGYGSTTVDAIAEAAGVSRKTVFTSVGGKIKALKLARDWAIVGDDEPVAMLDRPQVRRVQTEPDARIAIREYVAVYCESAARLADIHHVIESAAGLDVDVRALSDETWQQRRYGMGRLAQRLAELGALRDGMSVETATDLLWTFNDPEVYRRLVMQCGWPVERFADWLRDTLLAQLIRKGYRPLKS